MNYRDLLDENQLDAAERLKSGSILCSEVGTGKSRTALYFYLKNFRNKGLYIITTARKRDTLDWEKECEPFGLSPTKVDSWNNIAKYKEVKGCFFIFDEQRVKGTGKWVKSFLKIARVNDWVLLSATPGDNWKNYGPVFVANGFYKNLTEYGREHYIYAHYTTYPKVTGYTGKGKLQKFRRQILVNMDSMKETVHHNIDIWSDYDAMRYKQVWRDRWNPFTNKPIENAAELCYTVRRIVNTDPSRMQTLLGLLQNHKKVIIFYNFDYELEELKGTLELVDWLRVAEWNGHRHQPIPDSNAWAYLVQYTAGAEGWNCIETNVIIFFSQSYSYAAMVQAAGRIDRRTTPFKDLYYYHFKSRSPIDLGIAKALKEKQKFNELDFVGRKEKF